MVGGGDEGLRMGIDGWTTMIKERADGLSELCGVGERTCSINNTHQHSDFLAPTEPIVG